MLIFSVNLIKNFEGVKLLLHRFPVGISWLKFVRMKIFESLQNTKTFSLLPINPHLLSDDSNTFVLFLFIYKEKEKNKTSPLGMIVFLLFFASHDDSKRNKKASNGAEKHITTLKKALFLSPCLLRCMLSKETPYFEFVFQLFHSIPLTPCRFFTTCCKKHLQNCALDGGARKASEREKKREKRFFMHIFLPLPSQSYVLWAFQKSKLCVLNQCIIFIDMLHTFDIKCFLSFLSLQENQMISPKTNLNDYYKNLRCNVMTFFEHNRMPSTIVGSNDNIKK